MDDIDNTDETRECLRLSLLHSYYICTYHNEFSPDTLYAPCSRQPKDNVTIVKKLLKKFFR